MTRALRTVEPMHVEVLFVDGCANHELACRNLVAALARTELSEVSVEERQVASEEEAKRWGMRGSPTILVDGRDLFGSQADEPSVSCRLYAGGAPSIDDFAQSLLQHEARPGS
jgi:hypothetical protein